MYHNGQIWGESYQWLAHLSVTKQTTSTETFRTVMSRPQHLGRTVLVKGYIKVYYTEINTVFKDYICT